MSRAEVNWEGCPTVENKVYSYSHTLFPSLPNDETLSYILCKRAIERLPDEKTYQLLGDIERALEPGGLLEAYVAEHDGFVGMWRHSDEPRNDLLGPNWKNESCHVSKYDRASLIKLFDKYGFDVQSCEEVSVEYPAFKVMLRKRSLLASWAYVDQTLFPQAAGLSILDIGPGANPYPKATHFFSDTYYKHRALMASLGKPMEVGDIQKGSPFQDKQFHFILASHIFEHLADPVVAAKELTRIGQSGLVIVPSIFKEFMFGWEEKEHVWWPLPSKKKNTLLMMRPNVEYQSKLMDKDFSSPMCAIFRAGNMSNENNRKLRHWYRKNEGDLDIVVPWEGEFKVEIYE